MDPAYRRRYPFLRGIRAQRCKTFMPGYPNQIKNMSEYNGGKADIHTTYQYMAPEGSGVAPPKKGHGDYGPIQFTDYFLPDGTYNPYNPTYPYPPDFTQFSDYSYKKYHYAVGENEGRCCAGGKIKYFSTT